jgi:hypothetical protein
VIAANAGMMCIWEGSLVHPVEQGTGLPLRTASACLVG